MAVGKFGSDRVLLYAVEPWATMGYGAPNFGNNVGTLSAAIDSLVDEIGSLQLFVMTHVDAMRKQPPSRNTVERICKGVNRIRQVLGMRQRDYNELRIEPGHATPVQKVFTIHPCPYFVTEWTVNTWLRQYNELVMIALTNMMQHSDNNIAITVTRQFASDIWQYFNEIKLMVGGELLNLKASELAAEDFEFTEAHWSAYAPSTNIILTEALNTPGRIFNLPTEDDLLPLKMGIAANLIAPNLKQWPVSGDADFASLWPEAGSGAAPGSPGDGDSTAAPVIGPPQT